MYLSIKSLKISNTLISQHPKVTSWFGYCLLYRVHLELIFLCHHQHHKSWPSSEGVSSLAFTCLVIVVLPYVTCPMVLWHDICDKIVAEWRVDAACLWLAGAFHRAVKNNSYDEVNRNSFNSTDSVHQAWSTDSVCGG